MPKNPFGVVNKALSSKPKPTTSTTARKATPSPAARQPSNKQVAANMKREVKTIKEGIKAERRPTVSAKDMPKVQKKIQAGKAAGKRVADPGTSRSSGSRTRSTRGY